jgi:hypothetical protein
MELFDCDAGSTRRVGDVTHKTFELQHAGQTVLRPQMRRQRTAVRPDEDELHLVAHHRVDAGIGEPVLHPAQRAAAAVRVR